jgi:hypothetical protein
MCTYKILHPFDFGKLSQKIYGMKCKAINWNFFYACEFWLHLFYVKLVHFLSKPVEGNILMIIKATKWKELVTMSRFGHTPNDFQTCFWPPKVHNLKNFLEDELFLTFLNREEFRFYEILMCHTCSQIFKNNIFCKINKMLNKVMQWT